MKKFTFGIIVLLAVSMFVPIVSAGEQNDGSASRSSETGLPDLGIEALYLLTQGQTRYHYYSVSPGTASMNVVVEWDFVDNSLTLTIYAPNGGPVYGPYRDGDDYWLHADILRTISNPGNYPGTWTFKVYGERVAGTEYYYFSVD
ncbi:MAG: hypothetical protein QMC96_12740 [Methanomicrobiales archaeon]|nr:hypothetical protein [Methanomicrobiales archaeon]